MKFLTGKLLVSLGLPFETERAQRWLRVNDKIVIYSKETEALADADPLKVDGKVDSSRYTKPESGYYVNSLRVERMPGDTFRLYSDTIVDGEVEKSFFCVVRGDGRLVTGTVNTFAFGEMPIDQGYVDELLEDSLVADHPWDVVERTEPAKPPAVAAEKAEEKVKVAAEKVDVAEEKEKPKKGRKRAEPSDLVPAVKEAKKLRSKKKVSSEVKREE